MAKNLREKGSFNRFSIFPVNHYDKCGSFPVSNAALNFPVKPVFVAIFDLKSCPSGVKKNCRFADFL